MRNMLAHAGKSGRRVVSAFIATAFAQETPEATSAQWRAVADQILPKVPKLAAILDEAEPDVLAYMTFPKQHQAKLHSTNPIERLNGEIKRQTWSASSRTTMPSSASSARCCMSRMTNGPCSGPAT
ncbi:transposase-like protein [Mesorhizobium shonense]|uniref:Mutator family transposase n=1 Tax=Mesorhizobium shonense TaxID=1209948 RepID=A0ABV2I591_9HYPH